MEAIVDTFASMLSAPEPKPIVTKPGTAAAGFDLVVRWAESNGWHRDRFGNFKKPHQPDLRLKMGRNVCKMETRRSDGTWMRLRGAFYRRLYIDAHGNLCGMRR